MKEKIEQAALEYARNHSSAPDKETPDWIIADFKAGVKWAQENICPRLSSLEAEITLKESENQRQSEVITLYALDSVGRESRIKELEAENQEKTEEISRLRKSAQYWQKETTQQMNLVLSLEERNRELEKRLSDLNNGTTASNFNFKEI